MDDQDLKLAGAKVAALISNNGQASASQSTKVAIMALIAISRNYGVPDQMVLDVLGEMYCASPVRTDA
jgi:hypothetical protein